MLKKSQKFFVYSLAFIIGIGTANFFNVQINFLVIFMIGCFFSYIFFKSEKVRLVMLAVIFFILGTVCFYLHLPKVNEQHIAFYNEQKVIFQGVVQEPDVRLDHTKLTIETNMILLNENEVGLGGRVLVKTELYPTFDYGDYIQVECKLHEPQPIEDFRYDKYLARYNIYSTCSYAKIKLLKKNQGNFVISSLLKLKNLISEKINSTIAEPQASFLAGILIGSRKGIPTNLLTAFNRTGVTHIIAISGYNITIISVMIMNLCLAVGLHRKRAFYVIVIGIIFFTIITGASAAVVRSAVMGILVLFTKFLGRKMKVHNVLAFTAVCMLIVNPKILLDDAGFQLSFLATIGLIYFVPVIDKYFTWLPDKFALQENFVTTISAIILTTPLILYQFERLSIVAPLVNILILSFIPLSMLTGFVQVLGGFIDLDLGRAIGWLTWVVLEYIIRVVDFFSNLNFAAIDLPINLFSMLFCYIMLISIIILNAKNRKFSTVS